MEFYHQIRGNLVYRMRPALSRRNHTPMYESVHRAPDSAILPLGPRDTLSAVVEVCPPGRSRYAHPRALCSTESGPHRAQPTDAFAECPVMPVGPGATRCQRTPPSAGTSS